MIDVSVVIPTFRRPELLREAIDSALTQEGVSTEIVVIDDSPEGSARAVCAERNDSRVIYVQNPSPSGGRPALVRNSGWPMTRGRFVHFLDDDDRVAAGYYRAAVDAFEAHPRSGVVFGRIEPFSETESTSMAAERAFFADAARRARLAARIEWRHWLVANLLFQQTVLVNSACMIRRECIAGLGGYDPDIQLNEDVDFYCRAIRAHGFHFLDRVVVHYRILGDSLMHGRRNNQGLLQAYQRMYSLYVARHGRAELFALKVMARTVLRVV
jgi:GT2 family glycosyltransferase